MRNSNASVKSLRVTSNCWSDFILTTFFLNCFSQVFKLSWRTKNGYSVDFLERLNQCANPSPSVAHCFNLREFLIVHVMAEINNFTCRGKLWKFLLFLSVVCIFLLLKFDGQKRKPVRGPEIKNVLYSSEG